MGENIELREVENQKVPAVSVQSVQSLIYVIRGRQVMLDSDLAMLYQVETKRLNEAVKRNITRFPEEFRFQLTEEEDESLRSQFATLNENEGRGAHRKYLPYVFTEQGIAMLSAVLRSEIAIQVSIRIMETFVEMRKYLANSSLLLDKINSIESRQIESEQQRTAFEAKTEERFEQVFAYISSHEKSYQKIFYDGQIYDAFSLLTDLVRRAKENIILIDGYVDIDTLNILAKKAPGINALIYTLPGTELTTADIEKFNAQYPKLEVKYTKVFHDRFLIIDETEGYHIGASLKDAGKKCFGISKIEGLDVVKELIHRAEGGNAL